MQNKRVVGTEEITVRSSLAGIDGWFQGHELVKNTRGWSFAVVKEEKHPQRGRVVESQFFGDNDSCFGIVIVLGEIAHRREHAFCGIVAEEDEIAAPDLSDGVCLHDVRRDNAKVAASSLDGSEDIRMRRVGRRDHGAVGKYELDCSQVVGCPAVLGAKERKASSEKVPSYAYASTRNEGNDQY